MAFKMKPSSFKKTRAERIQSRKGGSVANVTERLDEGNIKGAAISRRANVAASKGNKRKAQRLRRKIDTADQKHWDSLSPEQRAEANQRNKEK